MEHTFKVQAGAHCTETFAQQYLVPLLESGQVPPHPGADYYAVCYGDICAYRDDGKLLAIYDLGVQIARHIVKGDVQSARAMFYIDARKPVSWSVPEIRALLGACRFAQKKWNAKVFLEQFL